MENNKSLLLTDSITIAPKILINIPTIGDILESEKSYYSLVSAFTSTPFDYMVQLDDMGIDYTEISEFELFMLLFLSLKENDVSLIFKDLDIANFNMYLNSDTNENVLYNQEEDIVIDKFLHSQIADCLRKLNNITKTVTKPGNAEAKRYLLEKERRKHRRNAKKEYEPYLEKMVVALVNRSEFKYNYEEVMDLSIYKFNQSFKQIQTGITFNNTMHGVYSGTLDTSKLKDKSCLSWI